MDSFDDDYDPPHRSGARRRDTLRKPELWAQGALGRLRDLLLTPVLGRDGLRARELPTVRWPAAWNDATGEGPGGGLTEGLVTPAIVESRFDVATIVRAGPLVGKLVYQAKLHRALTPAAEQAAARLALWRRIHDAWLALKDVDTATPEVAAALMTLAALTLPAWRQPTETSASSVAPPPPPALVEPPAPSLATAAHPRGYRGTRRRPPTSPSRRVDLQAWLCAWTTPDACIVLLQRLPGPVCAAAASHLLAAPDCPPTLRLLATLFLPAATGSDGSVTAAVPQSPLNPAVERLAELGWTPARRESLPLWLRLRLAPPAATSLSGGAGRQRSDALTLAGLEAWGRRGWLPVLSVWVGVWSVVGGHRTWLATVHAETSLAQDLANTMPQPATRLAVLARYLPQPPTWSPGWHDGPLSRWFAARGAWLSLAGMQEIVSLTFDVKPPLPEVRRSPARQARAERRARLPSVARQAHQERHVAGRRAQERARVAFLTVRLFWDRFVGDPQVARPGTTASADSVREAFKEWTDRSPAPSALMLEVDGRSASLFAVLDPTPLTEAHFGHLLHQQWLACALGVHDVPLELREPILRLAVAGDFSPRLLNRCLQAPPALRVDSLRLCIRLLHEWADVSGEPYNTWNIDPLLDGILDGHCPELAHLVDRQLTLVRAGHLPGQHASHALNLFAYLYPDDLEDARAHFLFIVRHVDDIEAVILAAPDYELARERSIFIRELLERFDTSLLAVSLPIAQRLATALPRLPDGTSVLDVAECVGRILGLVYLVEVPEATADANAVDALPTVVLIDGEEAQGLTAKAVDATARSPASPASVASIVPSGQRSLAERVAYACLGPVVRAVRHNSYNEALSFGFTFWRRQTDLLPTFLRLLQRYPVRALGLLRRCGFASEADRPALAREFERWLMPDDLPAVDDYPDVPAAIAAQVLRDTDLEAAAQRMLFYATRLREPLTWTSGLRRFLEVGECERERRDLEARAIAAAFASVAEPAAAAGDPVVPPFTEGMRRRLASLKARQPPRDLSPAQQQAIAGHLHDAADLLLLKLLDRTVDRQLREPLIKLLGRDPGPEAITERILNALRLYRTVDYNRRTLARMLRTCIRHDLSWIDSHPANVEWLTTARRAGIAVEVWREPRRRTIDGTVPLTVRLSTDPFEVLEMGNLANTCLAVGGVNSYSAISNAVDANKRVVYIEDPQGRVLARRLVVLDTQFEFLAFPIYYASGQSGLLVAFDSFCRDFARDCNATLFTTEREYTVARLIAPRWYDDYARPFPSDPITSDHIGDGKQSFSQSRMSRASTVSRITTRSL